VTGKALEKLKKINPVSGEKTLTPAQFDSARGPVLD